jgi:L-lactate dehydrogenase (cytochrome)
MSWEEVGKHDLRDDTWIVIDSVVYDVTKFKEKHPGGVDAIMNRAGKNATKAFTQANHPNYVIESKLPRHMVGRISPDSCIESWQKE